jgi:hypothetical protein
LNAVHHHLLVCAVVGLLGENLYTINKNKEVARNLRKLSIYFLLNVIKN